MPASTRQRLIDAAVTLFTEAGYEATSVDDIAAKAGTGRTTFFRHFPTKDDVVFPDHDALLARVESRLQTGNADSYRIAVREAARIVLDHYLAEGDTARRRYQLIHTVPALRDRESATVQRYVHLFRRHLREWLRTEPDGPLRAELLAATITTAHNYVLRDWLRGDPRDPTARFEHAIDRALRTGDRHTPDGRTTTVVVTSGDTDIDAILDQVRQALSRTRD